MKYFRVILIGFVFVLLIGCASRGVMINTTPTEVRLSQYRSLWVSVSSEAANEDEMRILADEVVRMLNSTTMFEQISGPGDSSAPLDLHLQLNIVDIYRVSQQARVFAGAMPGKAKILVDGDLIDTSTQQKIGNFRVEGKSSGGSVFAGDTGQAILRAAEMIVEYISRNH
jgi:hypothetical protein